MHTLIIILALIVFAIGAFQYLTNRAWRVNLVALGLALLTLSMLVSCNMMPGSAGGSGSAAVISKDPVVNAEKLTVITDATLNTLFTLEKQNRVLVVKYAPEVHRQVDNLRRAVGPTGADGKTLLERLRDVTKAYEQSSTPENLVNLQAITTTVAAVLEQAKQFQTQVASLTTKTP